MDDSELFGMGCEKSKLADGLDANENTVIISKEDQANGNGEELVKIEGVEAAENSLHGGNREAGGKPTTVTNRQSRLRKSDGGREIENAWGAVKITKNVELVVPGKRQIFNDVDFESEYGRDGVDMTSTSVGGDTDKLVNNSVVERTSPDGTNFLDYNEGMNKPRDLCKVNTNSIVRYRLSLLINHSVNNYFTKVTTLKFDASVAW